MSTTPPGAPVVPDPLPVRDGRSRILGGGTRVEGRRAVAVALTSTAIFVAIVVVVAVSSPGWDGVPLQVPQHGGAAGFPSRGRPGIPRERPALPDRGGPGPGPRPRRRGPPEPPRARVLPDPAARRDLHRPLPWHPDRPGDLRARARERPPCRSRASRSRRSSGPSWPSSSCTRRTSRRSIEPGSSRCTRARSPRHARSGSPGGSRTRYVVLPQAVRRIDPAAPERLPGPAEGHGARRVDRRDRGVPAGADRQLGDVQLHAVPRDRASTSS